MGTNDKTDKKATQDQAADGQQPKKPSALEEMKAENLRLQAQLATAESKIDDAVDEITRLTAFMERQEQQRQEQPKPSLRDLVSKASNDEDDRYEKLTNRQLLDVISDVMDQVVNTKVDHFQAAIDEANKKVGERSDRIEAAIIKLAAGMSWKDAETRHPDFGEYRNEVAEAVKAYPDLSPTDAYLLAKARRLQGTPPREETESEKPNSGGQEQRRVVTPPGTDAYDQFATRANMQRMARDDSQTNTRGGVAGFRDMIDDAISRRDAGG